MPDFRPAPLTASDSTLYVERSVDAEIVRALGNGDNVLLGAARGSGTTSLLYRLEDALSDAVYLNAERAESAEDLLASLAVRLTLEPIYSAELRRGRDPLAPVAGLDALRSRLGDASRRPTVLVDGPIDPGIAFELFGRSRDALFALPMTWLVAANLDRLAEYVTPPADVFFDRVVRLPDFSGIDALDALSRRNALTALSEPERARLADSFDGTPRHLLRLARAFSTAPQHDARAHADAAAALSRGARALMLEMQGRGPVAATDDELRSRLGVTDRQMRRYLSELEAVELAELVPGGRPGPGRPPSVYALTALGLIGAAT